LLKHNYIGTEHLLLGLLREEEGLAARVLSELGVELEDVRARARMIVGEGQNVQTGQIPFTPRAKQALELSLREALRLGHGYIGTEHVLLGLARREAGVASEIFRDLGMNRESIHAAVIGGLGGRPSAEVRTGAITVHTDRTWPRQEDVPGRRSFDRAADFVVGWLLFGAALGIGILIGWAIWHH
jgi:ATP-dependent Clp protease ATP-binding subunit ClpC